MKTKRLLALLCGVLPLMVSAPASATPLPVTFTNVLSWGVNGDPNNVTLTGTLSEDWDLTGISWIGSASANLDTIFNSFGGTNVEDLYVNIMLGAWSMDFQLGTPPGQLPATPPSPFTGSSSFSSVSGLSGDTLTFRFFEQKDDWATIESTIPGLLQPPSSYDALWNEITFNFSGAPIPFCTAHPTDPTCNTNPSPTPNPGSNPGSVPEPATLALLGLGLAGIGLMRRRVR